MSDFEQNITEQMVDVKASFPKLALHQEGNGYIVSGAIDIIDPYNGKQWEFYDVKIIIPPDFPKGLPKTFEVSNKIPQNETFHKNWDGSCCFSPDVEQFLILGKGFTLLDYIQKLVFKHLANHTLLTSEGGYINGEYKHFGEGLLEYYHERFQTNDPSEVEEGLKVLAGKKQYARNENCYCGKRLNNKNVKYKSCHSLKLGVFQSIDKKYFIRDLQIVQDEIKRQRALFRE